MDHSVRFWDRIAKRYSRQPIADEAAYEKKLQVTREHLRPDMHVMEFGCGTGSTALLHAPYVKHIRAIDVSSKMIEIAQAKADAQNIENVTFECARIDGFTAPEQSFDAVLGLNVLHLVENTDETIAMVYRLLRPGGFFVSSTACVADMNVLFRMIAPVGDFLRVIPRVNVFTAAALEESLTTAGFQVVYRWLPGRNKALFLVAGKPA